MNNSEVIERAIKNIEEVKQGKKSVEWLETAIQQLRDAQKINRLMKY